MVFAGSARSGFDLPMALNPTEKTRAMLGE